MTTAWLVSAAPASAQSTLIGTARCAPTAATCSGIDGDGFVIAWNTWDARARLYVPLVFHSMPALPQAVRTRVRGRRTPFDFDVYGGAVRVYSRCAGDPGDPVAGARSTGAMVDANDGWVR